MKKLKTNKLIIMIIAIALCLSVSGGLTLAYFSDYEEASGGATLNLGGGTELTEGSDKANKNIVIENVGEANMIVRLAIFGEDQYMTISHKNGDESAWKKIGDFYYYKKVLRPGEKTPQIDANLKVEWKGEEPDYNFEVTVVHESAPAVYNGETLATPSGWDDISEIIAPAPLTGEGE